MGTSWSKIIKIVPHIKHHFKFINPSTLDIVKVNKIFLQQIKKKLTYLIQISE